MKYVYIYLKVDELTVESTVPVPAAKHEPAFQFVPTAKSLRIDYFTGKVTLLIDAREFGTMRGIKSAGQYSVATISVSPPAATPTCR